MNRSTPPDMQTVHALRSDLPLQIARYVRRHDLTQISAAARLGIPQPTVSKIMNGKCRKARRGACARSCTRPCCEKRVSVASRRSFGDVLRWVRQGARHTPPHKNA